MNDAQSKKCRALAKKVRIHCLKMVHKGKSGHIGSMLSMADILPVLYTQILKIMTGDMAAMPFFSGIKFYSSYSYQLRLAAREKAADNSKANLKYKGRDESLCRIGHAEPGHEIEGRNSWPDHSHGRAYDLPGLHGRCRV